MRKRFAFCFG